MLYEVNPAQAEAYMLIYVSDNILSTIQQGGVTLFLSLSRNWALQ